MLFRRQKYRQFQQQQILHKLTAKESEKRARQKKVICIEKMEKRKKRTAAATTTEKESNITWNASEYIETGEMRILSSEFGMYVRTYVRNVVFS